MIVHVTAVILAIVSIEIVFYFRLANMYGTSFVYMRKIISTTTSKTISDNWKEKSILRYSMLLLSSSFKIIGILMIIILLYSITSYLYQPFSRYILSITGLVETTLFVIVYVYIRRFIYAKL